MDRERAADEAHARRARAELLQPVDARLDDRGLVAQAEVVVRREDQHLAAPFHLHARRLRRVEIVEPLVDAVRLELLDRCLRARRSKFVFSATSVVSVVRCV